MSDEDDRVPYLVRHPPARPQFRTQRRASVTGAIVVHTFEAIADINPPDEGAERGARIISQRTDGPGSYHTLVDSDSAAQLGYYRWEMFGEGTGGNRWALHLSFYCHAAHWRTLPDSWVLGAIEQGAQEAARMARWVKNEHGITVPAKWITGSQYGRGQAGFITHKEIEDTRGTPGRRSDPGNYFPRATFTNRFAELTNQGGIMPDYPTDDVKTIQERLQRLDYDIGPTGVDGILGPRTMDAYNAAMNDLTDCAGTIDPEMEKKAGLLDEFAEATSQIEDGQESLDDIRSRIRDLYSL